ncbi:hypothetical protein RQN9TF_31960 (plasmid) [Rhodococcus qingshengii]|uniref:hypothetical protein n=1 Tax=Rhodococcus TaxID=1827 RepID=UPI000F618087|nr:MULTISPECIES: hypothetical protein [Rhodococcus]AZI65906.1 hypothetical protein EHW12_33115 [Rhodococcus sp. NJ-530]BDQ23873.1 hypothetical protein RQN9TF_31960 [Rhodococcus qingshengii]
MRRRAATLLADEHGYICSQILPFIVYLAAEERRPDSTLRWLDHPKTIALLQHIARVEHPIVHADLDAHPRPLRCITFVRSSSTLMSSRLESSRWADSNNGSTI